MNKRQARQLAKEIIDLLEATFQPPYGELEIREIVKVLTTFTKEKAA